jgi:hypothetical protein
MAAVAELIVDAATEAAAIASSARRNKGSVMNRDPFSKPLLPLIAATA